MSRKTAASAIDLIRRTRIASELGNYVRPFSYFCLNFHNFSRNEKPFSAKPPRIDFSCVKELDDAVHLFDEMVRMQPQPSVVDFTKLLNVVVKMKHYSFALYMFDEMRRMGAPVNDYTMNIVINCYCLLKCVDFGFAIMGIFFKSGYKLDAATFSTLIKGLFLDDKVADAVKLFEKFLKLRVCEPNDVMILTFIDGLCKSGNVLAACDWLHRLERSRWRPNVCAYNTLIDRLSKSQMVDDAFHVLHKMIDKSISPDVISYNSMIQGLCDVGRLEDVKYLVNEMTNSDISLNVFTFNILIDANCKEGRMKEAEDVLEIMKQHNICPDIFTYNALIDGFCLRGEIKETKQVLDSMVERGLKPNIVSYGSLINGYCKKGRVDEAWLRFLEVPHKGLEHDACSYTTMIHGLFSRERFADGWKVLKDMELDENGKTDEAVSLLRMIEAKGVNPNIVTYGALINGLCKNGKHDVARDLFNQLPSRGLQPDVWMYTMIIDSFCQEGAVEEAKKRLFVEMEHRGCAPVSATYNVIVRSLLKKNELHKAIPYLEEMHERGFPADTATFSMLIDQLQGQGEDDLIFFSN